MTPLARGRRPFTLILTTPTEMEEGRSLAVLQGLVESVGMQDWFDLVIAEGPWSVWWDDRLLWQGDDQDPKAWEDALLEAWWGSGGGCC